MTECAILFSISGVNPYLYVIMRLLPFILMMTMIKSFEI